jgi:L-fuconolactonase
VLDHCGKPPFGDDTAWRHWESRFIELAARSNVVVKLSGLFGGSGATTAATDDELARVVELARSIAGADRTMLGSDWPMSRDRLGYAAGLEKLSGLLSTWSADEQALATSGTAQKTYGLS